MPVHLQGINIFDFVFTQVYTNKKRCITSRPVKSSVRNRTCVNAFDQ